jgi:hypothetical protein
VTFVVEYVEYNKSLQNIGCIINKNVKYAYHEWPHPADTASLQSQKVDRRREHSYTIINFKIDATNESENSQGLDTGIC